MTVEIFEEPLDVRSGLHNNWFVVGEACSESVGGDPSERSPDTIIAAFINRHDAELFVSTYKDVTRLPEYQEYVALMEGFKFTSEHRGLFYEANILWMEDRNYDLEIIKVETLPESDMQYWFGGSVLTDFDADLLVELISNSPEAKEFQNRINEWCDTISDELAELITDAYEAHKID